METKRKIGSSRILLIDGLWSSGIISSTGVAIVKLLSALVVSTDNYCLGSIDIGDAYLQVEQDELTSVEVDSERYELGIYSFRPARWIERVVQQPSRNCGEVWIEVR